MNISQPYHDIVSQLYNISLTLFSFYQQTVKLIGGVEFCVINAFIKFARHTLLSSVLA